MFSILIHC